MNRRTMLKTAVESISAGSLIGLVTSEASVKSHRGRYYADNGCPRMGILRVPNEYLRKIGVPSLEDRDPTDSIYRGLKKVIAALPEGTWVDSFAMTDQCFIHDEMGIRVSHPSLAYFWPGCQIAEVYLKRDPKTNKAEFTYHRTSLGF